MWFTLDPRHPEKSSPALVADDDRHFDAVSARIDQERADLDATLAAAAGGPGGGQFLLDRDLQVQRLARRRQELRRLGADLCLGRMDLQDGGRRYIGRTRLQDADGSTLMLDWRSPEAEPFFAATHADPRGLARRRRYRWRRGRVVDFWDEAFTADARRNSVALEEVSSFLADLDTTRTDRMRDVLSTLQADQHAVVREPSDGVLVVDGGPGTGKTVVALHRTAHLLYADPRLSARGGVLFVGPSRPYLHWVSDILPGLDDQGVRTCVLADLVPQGATARPEPDPAVAALKAGRELTEAVERAVRFHEQLPPRALVVDVAGVEVVVTADHWARAADTLDPALPHNHAQGPLLDALVEVLADELGSSVPVTALRRQPDLRAAVRRAWPVVTPTDLLGDLWSVPAYLRHCAPTLSADQISLLQRPEPQAWTEADLPLLDAAAHLLGDPEVARRRRAADRSVAARHEVMDRVVQDAIEADDTELQVMSMLRGDDLRDALVDPADAAGPDRDPWAGPFGHVVVDEAQELTDAQWLMLLRRCPSGSFTVVGDRLQARHGFDGSWAERLGRVGLHRVRVRGLTVNYRTPAPVMDVATTQVRAAFPDATVPVAARTDGPPVRWGAVHELADLLGQWASRDEGIGCVLAVRPGPAVATAVATVADRVVLAEPWQVKGLEFDLVVLIDPDAWGQDVTGAVDRYVATTRATRHLVVLGPSDWEVSRSR